MADYILEREGEGFYCDYFCITNIAKIRIPILNASSLKAIENFEGIHQLIIFQVVSNITVLGNST